MASVLPSYTEKRTKVPYFEVSNNDSLADEQIRIVLRGVPPLKEFTLRSCCTNSAKHCFSAFGYHYSDESGNIDLYSNPSIGGSYSNIDPMALFWSITPDEGQKKGLRFVPDVLKPTRFTIYAYCGHVSDFNAEKPVAEIVVRRHWKSDSVGYHNVRAGRLRGVLFYPKTAVGKMPAILDIYGFGGGLMSQRPALLASKGFVTLSLAYFRYMDLPKTMEKVDLDYFLEAIDYLRNLDFVHPDRIGAIGISKGADIMLQVAALTPHIKALAFINGFAFPMLIYSYWKGGHRKPIPVDWSKVEEDEDGCLILQECHWHETNDYSQIMPIEQVKGKIMIFASENDKNVPSIRNADILVKKLDSFGRSGNCCVVKFEGAGHILEPAYMPLCGSLYVASLGGYVSAMGGIPDKHHQAQLRFWRLLIDFFKTNLCYENDVIPHKL